MPIPAGTSFLLASSSESWPSVQADGYIHTTDNPQAFKFAGNFVQYYPYSPKNPPPPGSTGPDCFSNPTSVNQIAKNTFVIHMGIMPGFKACSIG